MPAWLFQGNPDHFAVDEYLRRTWDITWSVNQTHLAPQMGKGDEVFIWRAAGKAKGISGCVARGHLTSSPEVMPEDEASDGLWAVDPSGPALRVGARLVVVKTGKKQVVQKKWLERDPVLSNMMILRMMNNTNYLLTAAQAKRLRDLLDCTGDDWNRDESLAGLWAYVRTLDGPISRKPGAPVAIVSERIGRAMPGVYNKVMNFRSLDPNDARSGLQSSAYADKAVWAEFFDEATKTLDVAGVLDEYYRVWSGVPVSAPKKYLSFGDAPDDDPEELQWFAAKVRRGQPEFRKNLLAAFGERCAITDTGPAQVLEAVHIVPHAKSGVNALDNGLLMRADLHHLFDAGLLKIDPDSQQMVLADALAGTVYWELQGREIRARVDGSRVAETYLRERWNG